MRYTSGAYMVKNHGEGQNLQKNFKIFAPWGNDKRVNLITANQINNIPGIYVSFYSKEKQNKQKPNTIFR